MSAQDRADQKIARACLSLSRATGVAGNQLDLDDAVRYIVDAALALANDKTEKEIIAMDQRVDEMRGYVTDIDKLWKECAGIENQCNGLLLRVSKLEERQAEAWDMLLSVVASLSTKAGD